MSVLTAINPADAVAAMRGDPAAMLRIQQMKQFHEAGQPKRREQGKMQSFASFHPPLVKRAKRLQKMGSHLIAPVRAGGWVWKVFMTVLYLIIVPLLTVAAGLMLIVIGMLIGMNLMLLAEGPGALSNHEREVVATALLGCEQLGATVDELLDVTRIEAGKLRLDLERLDVDAAIQRSVSALRKR